MVKEKRNRRQETFSIAMSMSDTHDGGLTQRLVDLWVL